MSRNSPAGPRPGPERAEQRTRPQGSVADTVRGAMAGLSAAELRVARVLLSAYPTAGLGSAADLAGRAGVSAPTVVRFAARLGYPGYRDLQRQLREELQRERTASPLTITTRPPAGRLRAAAGEVFTQTVGRTFADLPDAELDRAVALVADPARRIVSIGGRYSHVLATYADLHLRQMRKDTVVAPAPSRRSGFLLDLGKRDVCLVFDVRRYQRDVIDLARDAHGAGAALVLLTDPWLSPLAAVADVVLPVRVEGPSPFDSLVPGVAVVETLVAGVLEALGPAAQDRMRRADALSATDTLERFDSL